MQDRARKNNFIPFDLVASRLVREPFNQSVESIRRLDPISARLLFFRDPEWDEIYDPNVNVPPPSLAAFDRFVETFKKQGYNEEQIERLWTHYQTKLQKMHEEFSSETKKRKSRSLLE